MTAPCFEPDKEPCINPSNYSEKAQDAVKLYNEICYFRKWLILFKDYFNPANVPEDAFFESIGRLDEIVDEFYEEKYIVYSQESFQHSYTKYTKREPLEPYWEQLDEYLNDLLDVTSRPKPYYKRQRRVAKRLQKVITALEAVEEALKRKIAEIQKSSNKRQ